MNSATRLTLLILLLGCPDAWAKNPTKITAPPLVVGQKEPAKIAVAQLAGQGKASASVNVGRIVSIAERGGGGVELSYLPPAQGSPQRLMLLLWRQRGKPVVFTLSMSAWTKAEVKARRGRNLKVTVKVGDKVFGPVMSGKKRKVTVRVLVPVGVRVVEAEARSERGLVARRRVKLPPVFETPLVAGVRQSGERKKGSLRFELFSASVDGRMPSSRLYGPGKEVLGDLPGARHGRVNASKWRPPKSAAAGRWTLVVRSGASELRRGFDLAALPPPPKVVKKGPTTRPIIVRKSPPPPPSRLRPSIAVRAGLMHNLGKLQSPQFALELGIDYRTKVGYFGGRLFGGFSWSSQDVQVREVSLSNTVLLMPVGLGPCYTTPRFGGFSFHLLAAGILQIIRSETEGERTGTVKSTELAFGVLTQLGADYLLGPGELFVRAGYQYARVDSADLELLAGGLVFDGGYRLLF